jgi:hypothetical protein
MADLPRDALDFRRPADYFSLAFQIFLLAGLRIAEICICNSFPV